jgi:hypothetical protein
LVDSPGPAFAIGAKLGVVFSVPLVGVSFAFATDGAGPLELDVYTGDFNDGSNPTYTVTVSGLVQSPPYTFPEGVMSFSGGPFSSIIIQGPSDPFFSIGAITATTSSPMDEPTSGAVLSIGLCVLLLWRTGAVSRAFRGPDPSGR